MYYLPTDRETDTDRQMVTEKETGGQTDMENDRKANTRNTQTDIDRQMVTEEETSGRRDRKANTRNTQKYGGAGLDIKQKDRQAGRQKD